MSKIQFLIFALLGLALFFAPLYPFLSSGHTNWAIAYLLFAGTAVFFSFTSPTGMAFNFYDEKRRDLICNLIESTKEELIVYSGWFDASIFNSDKVLNSLKRLPTDVCIKFYMQDGGMDPASNEFRAFLKERGKSSKIEFYCLKEPILQNHFMVSDKSHIRIELFSSMLKPAQHTGPKLAVYFYDSEFFASYYLKRMQKSFEGNTKEHKPVSIPLFSS